MSDQASISHPVTRRRFLQGTALAGTAAFLAACGSGGGSAAPGGSGGTGAGTGTLKFANWDAYIDLTTLPGADGELGTDDDEYDLPSPTLEEFTAET